MGELTSALDGLAGEDLFGLTDAQLLDRVRELVAVQNRVAGELARTVRRAELAQAVERDGLKTMASWLRGHARLSGPAAARVVRTGRALEHLPVLAGGFAAGAVTADQVDVAAPIAAPENLAAAAEQDVDLTEIDVALSEVAARCPHADLARVVHAYLAALDPDGPEPDPTEGRSLTLAQHADGSVTGRFWLDALGGEKLQTALEAIVQANRPAGDARSRAQRQADALVQLADNALAHGDLPLLRTVQPHVVLTVPVADLVDPAAGPDVAETGFGATLSAARARWAACDAQITRIVLDADGQPLDVGRTKRVVPPHLRRAVEHRDKHRGVVEMCRAPAATPPAIGARCIIWCIGPWAEKPPWTIPGCSAKPTTPRSTTASGSNEIPTGDGTPSGPMGPVSISPHRRSASAREYRDRIDSGVRGLSLRAASETLPRTQDDAEQAGGNAAAVDARAVDVLRVLRDELQARSVSVTQFFPARGFLEIEHQGRPTRLHFTDKELLKLRRVARGADAAARSLIVYLDESLETSEPHPSGSWEFANHRFVPSPPIDLPPLSTDDPGRRGPSLAYFLSFGALWSCIALFSWVGDLVVYLKVVYTVLAVFWLGAALVALGRKKRAERCDGESN